MQYVQIKTSNTTKYIELNFQNIEAQKLIILSFNKD